MKYTISIPNWHPVRLNVLMAHHWGKGHRRKSSDKDIVAGYARLCGIPEATGKRRVTLTIVLGPRQRGSDPDAFWKSLLDALKACKMIVDDSKEWVELSPVQYKRGACAATDIVLEDIGKEVGDAGSNEEAG